MEEQEFGRIQKSDKTEIVIKSNNYEGRFGIDIREFVSGTKFEGYTNKGIKIPIEKWEEFKEIIDSIKLQ